jgi:glycosyltransferase involved in cell wall biosynthesis
MNLTASAFPAACLQTGGIKLIGPAKRGRGASERISNVSSLQIEDSPQSGTKLFDLFSIEGPSLAFNQKAYNSLVPRSGDFKRKKYNSLVPHNGATGIFKPPFRNRRILILSDHDPDRICGHTIHLNYLAVFLKRWNHVDLTGRATLHAVRAADVVWIRSEKLFLRWIPICLLTGKSTLYDLASFPWLELEMAGRPWIRILFSRWTFRLALKTAVVRVLSTAMAESLRNDFQIPEDRMFVMPIPVHLPRARRRSRTDGRLHFVYMGSDKPWQGFRNLIDAFARLESDSSLMLHCFGIPGTDTKNVRFHASVPHPEMIRILACRMDVVVVPRPRNPVTEHVTPIKFAEAAAMGLRILATDLKVLREAGVQNVFLIPDNETETLVSGIESIKRERKNR